MNYILGLHQYISMACMTALWLTTKQWRYDNLFTRTAVAGLAQKHMHRQRMTSSVPWNRFDSTEIYPYAIILPIRAPKC